MHGGDVRIGHVRHQAEAGRDKAGIIRGAMDGPGELRAEAAAYC